MKSNIKLSETGKALIGSLKLLKVKKDLVVGLMLMLDGNEELMEDMLIWVYDNRPTEDEIAEKMVDISIWLRMLQK